MKKKRKKKKTLTIGKKDFMKAIKKANREIQLDVSPGWQAVSKVHKDKKAYSRKRDKKVLEKEDE